MKPLGNASRALLSAARPAEASGAADRDRIRARVMAATLAVATTVAAGSAAAGEPGAASAAKATTASAGKPGAASAAKATTAAMTGKSAAIATTPLLAKAILLGVLMAAGAAGTAAMVWSRRAPGPAGARQSPSSSMSAGQASSAAPMEAVSATGAVPTTGPVPATGPVPTTGAVAAAGTVKAAAAPPAPSLAESASARGGARPAPRPPASAPAIGLREEVAILQEAQQALRGHDANRAVAVLDSHEKDLAGGALDEERLAMRAVALCAAGRSAEAKRAVAAFLARAKGSPLEAHVREACKDTPSAAPAR